MNRVQLIEHTLRTRITDLRAERTQAKVDNQQNALSTAEFTTLTARIKAELILMCRLLGIALFTPLDQFPLGSQWVVVGEPVYGREDAYPDGTLVTVIDRGMRIAIPHEPQDTLDDWIKPTMVWVSSSGQPRDQFAYLPEQLYKDHPLIHEQIRSIQEKMSNARKG